MFSRIAKLFQGSAQAKLLSGAALAGILTMGVKGVGFLKELFVAYRFGTSDELDAYLVALLVPSLVAVALGGALRDGLIPGYSRERRRSEAAADGLVSNVLWVGAGALLGVALLLLLFDGPLMRMLASGFPPEKQERCARLLILLLPYVVFLGIATVLKGYLQANGRFVLSSAAPALLPVGTIVLLVALSGAPNGAWLSLGSGLGSLAVLAVLYAAACRLRNRSLLRKPGWGSPTRTVLWASLPLLAGTAVMEGFYFIDITMAAFLPAGSVATLSYGERICQVFSVAGFAMVQALFPHISDLAAAEDWTHFRRKVKRYVLLLAAGCLPLVLVLWFGSGFLVKILFERGEFDAEDTAQVSAVVRFAALQIPGYVLGALASRTVMALGANRFVLFTALAGLVANVFFNYWFMGIFGVPGIALSTAMVNAFMGGLLFLVAVRRVRILSGTTTAEK